MARITESGPGRRHPGCWRRAARVAAGLVLLLPLVAMGFTDEMNWGPADFLLFGAMLIGACGACELAARRSANAAYQAGVGVAAATAFILVWMNLAVGIIGDEGEPANLMFGAVLAIGVIAAAIARFRPQHGSRHGRDGDGSGDRRRDRPRRRSRKTVALTALFVTLWLRRPGLFRKAARRNERLEA